MCRVGKAKRAHAVLSRVGTALRAFAHPTDMDQPWPDH
jgi:hypothetical protein